MLRLKSVIIYLVLIITFCSFANEKQASIPSEKAQISKKLYQEALKYYRLKSYYSALDVLYKLTSNKKDPYYVPATFLLAKVYISIARKTGIKKYLTYADYLLNIYLSSKKKVGWNYYYTKGYLFEIWGFYERAMFYYKTSLFITNDKNKYFKSLIGILRTSIWFNKLDIITRYAIKLSLKDLFKHEENPEIVFLKGLYLFKQKKYNEAYKYLYKTYKENEAYLIENPEFYYIVAENMYRIKKYNFAKQLFRRIVSITQDLEIIRKSILRLGDIDIKQKDFSSAFNHYYYLATDYKGTKEATIAKLKIIGYMDIPEIKRRVENSDDKDLKNPLKFVVLTLITNRNSRLGRYALADFGNIVFKYNSDFLYKKLSWELSILEVDRLSYEEKEYFRWLWKDKLLKIKPARVCLLYTSNKKFFIEVFDKDYLVKLSKILEKCPKNQNIDLLKRLVKKYKDENLKILLAKAYYRVSKYKKSIETLKSTKLKNCTYYIILLKDLVMLNQADKIANYLNYLSTCNNKEKYLILAFYYLLNNKVQEAYDLIKSNLDIVLNKYNKDAFYKKVLELMVDKLIYQGQYEKVLQVISKIAEKYKEDCNINSWLLIGIIRTNATSNVDKVYEKIKNCNTRWAVLAKNIYEDWKLERRAKNESALE